MSDTRTNSPKTFTQTEVRNLIQERIKNSGIIFSDKPPQNPNLKLEVIIEHQTSQMLKCHVSTGSIFMLYCVLPFMKTIQGNEVFESTKTADRISTETIMIGLMNGCGELSNQSKLNLSKKSSPRAALKGLFSEEELESIGDYLLATFAQFPKQITKMIQWIIDHPQHEKDQLDIIQELGQAKTEGDHQRTEELFNKTEELLMGHPTHANHNLMQMNYRKQAGIPATPVEDFFSDLDTLLMGIEILHWNDYDIPYMEPEVLHLVRCTKIKQ